MSKQLKPPAKVEQEYTFTHNELRLLLLTFGTQVAMQTKKIITNIPSMTAHTNTWVIPAVEKEMEHLSEYYGE